MASLSGTKRLEGKDSDEAPVSTFIYMKKISQVLQVQELEEENEVLKTEILQLHTAAAEAPEVVADRKKVADLKRVAEREKENREMNEILAGLTVKINSMCDIYNADYFKFNEMANRLKSLEENYEPCIRRLIKKLKTTIGKEKQARKECADKLKEKEDFYEAREKELKETIYKLEQEIKEKTDKIAEISNEHFYKLPPPKCDVIRRSPSPNDGDDLSSFTSCYNEAFEVRSQKTFKYCGRRSSYAMDKALTYRHLRKTRTSIRFTDSESVNDEKRQKKMPK